MPYGQFLRESRRGEDCSIVFAYILVKELPYPLDWDAIHLCGNAISICPCNSVFLEINMTGWGSCMK